MSHFARGYLFLVGVAALAGAALHIAIIFGGPDWYAYFGAPRGLVEMARTGNIRAPISCLVIAAFLALLAVYAFSGARDCSPANGDTWPWNFCHLFARRQ